MLLKLYNVISKKKIDILREKNILLRTYDNNCKKKEEEKNITRSYPILEIYSIFNYNSRVITYVHL